MESVTLTNPYDFANPVSDKSVFAGREGELRDINYYLSLAEVLSQPIHVAIIGPRAFGKTSLLNMTEIEAKRRGFCTVRIDLDESDTKTQTDFFFKLFDSMFDSAASTGAFGGKQAITYRTYWDVVSGHGNPLPDVTHFPFQFPIYHARAITSGNDNVQVPDSALRSDLRLLRSEVSRPIIVIFDEANVLTEKRVLLQKLRNIFTRTPGFMVFVAGTPDLFPAIDRVFSPIGRQFKKIAVRAFDTLEETELCVRRPLERMGIAPGEVFDFSTKNLRTLHHVTGGRPYEIQLVCHMMFRRMQDEGAPKMALDLDVLAHVGRELEPSGGWSQRVHDLYLLEKD